MNGREMCHDWLRDKVLFLDTETTGLDDSAEIVEIAVVDHEGKPLFDSLIKPVVPITPTLTRIHGIDNNMVKDAPSWDGVYNVLCEVMTGKTVVAYNSDFDARMIHQTGTRYNLPALPSMYECAMQMYQNHTGHHKRFKLIEAAEACGISPMGKAHRAMSDVYMVVQIVQYIAWFNND